MLKNSLRQLLEISLMISPLIIFIFLLRKNILRRLGPTARLLLWLPLIIQLIVPVSWQTRRSPYQLVADEVQLNLLTHESSYQEIPLEEMTEETRTAAEFYDPTPVVKADLIMDSAVKIWLGGIAVLILVNFISQLRLRRRLQARGMPECGGVGKSGNHQLRCLWTSVSAADHQRTLGRLAGGRSGADDPA